MSDILIHVHGPAVRPEKARARHVNKLDLSSTEDGNVRLEAELDDGESLLAHLFAVRRCATGASDHEGGEGSHGRGHVTTRRASTAPLSRRPGEPVEADGLPGGGRSEHFDAGPVNFRIRPDGVIVACPRGAPAGHLPLCACDRCLAERAGYDAFTDSERGAKP